MNFLSWLLNLGEKSTYNDAPDGWGVWRRDQNGEQLICVCDTEQGADDEANALQLEADTEGLLERYIVGRYRPNK